MMKKRKVKSKYCHAHSNLRVSDGYKYYQKLKTGIRAECINPKDNNRHYLPKIKKQINKCPKSPPFDGLYS